MRSFYMRIFKNIICIYVLALCCFAYATMIHAIPDHVYVQEGQKLELDKKIPVTLAMSTKPQSVMAQIGERTFQAMKQERAVETCSQLKQGEYTLTCYLFGILPMKEVQVSVVNGKSLYVSGQVVGIYGAAQGVLVLGSGPVETVDGSSRQPAEHIVFPGDYITAVNGKAVTKKEELMERINQYGEQPVVLTLWRGAEQIQVSVEPVEAAEHKGYRLGLWVKDDMAGIGTLPILIRTETSGHWDTESETDRPKTCSVCQTAGCTKHRCSVSKKVSGEHRESWRELSIMGKTTRSEKCPAIHKSVSMAR